MPAPASHPALEVAVPGIRGKGYRAVGADMGQSLHLLESPEPRLIRLGLGVNAITLAALQSLEKDDPSADDRRLEARVEELSERIRRSCRHLLQRQGATSEDADSATSKVLESLLLKKEVKEVLPYARRAALNAWRDILRQRRPEQPATLLEHQADPQPDPEEAVLQREARLEVAECIEYLQREMERPEQWRLLQTYAAEFLGGTTSLEELAQQQGLSRHEYHQRVYRAKLAARRVLEKRR